MPKIFSGQPLARGNRLAIVTYTGAVGVIALDEGAKYGLTLARLSPGSRTLRAARNDSIASAPQNAITVFG